MTTALIRGNALALPLAAGTIDLILTSPPYFGLRSYTDAGEHYDGQIGSEPTPGEFLDALIAATAEMVRVLKPSGSIWVNLGDKYARPGGGVDVAGRNRNLDGAGRGASKRVKTPAAAAGGIPEKSLMGLPWRYALRCIDDLGLILRAEVIWSKPNGLPESVTDRVRRSHEQWFHMVKQPRYFAAVDHIREGYEGKPQRRGGTNHQVGEYEGRNKQTLAKQWDEPASGTNPLGKLPGSVWSVPTQPLTVPADLGVDHFAAFPMEWPRRIIQGWSPTGICTVCGEGRRPISKTDLSTDRGGRKANVRPTGAHFDDTTSLGRERTVTITGEQCACPHPSAPTRPAVVLDPFGGTGTTAIVANALGRHGISLDMSADYLRLASWRANDPGERAKAAGVDRPPAIPDGMDSLW